MGLIDTLRAAGALVLYHDYRSGNAYDYSGLGNAAATLTSPTWASRGGMFFHGSSRNTTNDAVNLRLTAGTLVSLGSFKGTVGTPRIIDKAAAGSCNYRLLYDSGNVYFTSGATTRGLAYTSLQGKRYLAVNFKDGEVAEFFADGVSIGSTALTFVVATTTDAVTTGNGYDGNNPHRNMLGAALIINRKLTASEHAQLFGELRDMRWPTKTICRAKPIGNINPQSDTLAAFVMERVGAKVIDFGTVKNDATTITGFPIFQNTTMGKATKHGQHATLDKVQTPSSTSYTFTSNFTLSCWYRPQTTATLAQIWGKGFTNYRLLVTAGALGGLWLNSNNLQLNTAAADIVRANTWCHLAVTYDGVTAKIYYNGVLSAQTPYNTAWVATDTGVAIGNDVSSGASAPGSVVDPKLWNRVLGDAEILQEYQRGRSAHSVGTAKQLAISATNRILGATWNCVTSTGTTGVELANSRVITYAQANAGAILRLAAYPITNRVSAANIGPSSFGQIQNGDHQFGTWIWTVEKNSDTSTVRLLPITNASGEWDSGGAFGYLVEIDANEAIGVYRITASAKAATIMQSANGYISRSAWHQIKLTRNVNGAFTLYVDGALVPASAGANPGSDTTYLTGNNLWQVSLSDGDRFALSCNTGECNFKRFLGVI